MKVAFTHAHSSDAVSVVRVEEGVGRLRHAPDSTGFWLFWFACVAYNAYVHIHVHVHVAMSMVMHVMGSRAEVVVVQNRSQPLCTRSSRL